MSVVKVRLDPPGRDVSDKQTDRHVDRQETNKQIKSYWILRVKRLQKDKQPARQSDIQIKSEWILRVKKTTERQTDRQSDRQNKSSRISGYGDYNETKKETKNSRYTRIFNHRP